MSGPAALAAQLENMASKNDVFRAAANEARRLSDACESPAKVQQLMTLCDELRTQRPDWRVVVFTQRKETQQTIAKALDRRCIEYGIVQGGSAIANQRAIEAFCANPS